MWLFAPLLFRAPATTVVRLCALADRFTHAPPWICNTGTLNTVESLHLGRTSLTAWDSNPGQGWRIRQYVSKLANQMVPIASILRSTVKRQPRYSAAPAPAAHNRRQQCRARQEQPPTTLEFSEGLAPLFLQHRNVNICEKQVYIFYNWLWSQCFTVVRGVLVRAITTQTTCSRYSRSARAVVHK